MSGIPEMDWCAQKLRQGTQDLAEARPDVLQKYKKQNHVELLRCGNALPGRFAKKIGNALWHWPDNQM